MVATTALGKPAMPDFARKGLALLEVREKREYQESHGTFDKYCRACWGITARQANRLIQSAQVVTSLMPLSATETVPRKAEPEAPEVAAPVVYFIQAGEFGLIKIGMAKDAGRRLRGIKTISPTPLRLLGTIPGSRRTESRLHRQFAHLREHGEWFRPETELLSFIAQEANHV